MSIIEEQTAAAMTRFRTAIARGQRGEVRLNRDEQGRVIPSGGPTQVQRDDARRQRLGDNIPGEGE